MRLSFNIRWFISFLLFVPALNLEAQIEQKNHPWWVNLGAGPSLIGNVFSMNAGMIYCYQLKESMISARMIGVTNKNPTVQRIDPTKTNYKFSDYGVLYGPLWEAERSFVSLGAGIGLVRAAYETPIALYTNTSISFPMEVQWFWRPTHYAGIGLYLYASLNSEKHLVGALLCAQLGMW
jgi:hypothetical protein